MKKSIFLLTGDRGAGKTTVSNLIQDNSNKSFQSLIIATDMKKILSSMLDLDVKTLDKYKEDSNKKEPEGWAVGFSATSERTSDYQNLKDALVDKISKLRIETSMSPIIGEIDYDLLIKDTFKLPDNLNLNKIKIDVDTYLGNENNDDLKHAISVRKIIQNFGTDAMKKQFGASIWSDLAFERVSAKLNEGFNVIVEDVRFLDEIEVFTKSNMDNTKVSILNIKSNDEREADNHITETALKDFNDFDLTITNKKNGLLELGQDINKLKAADLNMSKLLNSLVSKTENTAITSTSLVNNSSIGSGVLDMTETLSVSEQINEGVSAMYESLTP